MYRLILFDFDFTLVDSSKGIIKSIKYALRKNQYCIPSDSNIRNTIGLPLKDAFFTLCDTTDEKKYNLFKHFFMESSREVMCKNTAVFDDTIFTLQQLKKRGLKIAIVSAKDKKTIQKIAEQYDFLKYIDMIVGEHEVINLKPHPDQVQMVLDVLGIAATDTLYIGDNLIDGLTAERASVDFLALTTGTTTEHQFKEITTIGIVSRLKELLVYIE